jgi:photosystem II stability/assembly factor-like uncharacterized protein
VATRACGIVLALAALLAGCGGSGDDGGDTGTSGLAVPWVDPDGDPPYVGALSVNPADGTLFFASNTGLFRVPKGDGEPERVVGSLQTPDGSGEVSEALVVRFTGPDELIGSGHPPGGSALPPALGLIRSADAGRTWEPVSELGTADFHALQPSGNRLAAALYGEAQVLVSGNGGRGWETRVTPLPLVDLEVDPGDAARWVGTSENGIFVSTDEGRTWRQRDSTANVRVAWHAPGELYRVDPGGAVQLSADGGETWEERGTTGSEPQAITTGPDGALYVALIDGTLMQSRDGGRSWTNRLEGG